MKSLLISLIAIAACTVQAQQPCLKLNKVKIDKPLHRYGATEVKLKFEADAKAKNKDCYVLTESQSPDQQALTLDVGQAPVGVTARLEAVEAQQIDQSTVGTATLKAREISTVIYLDAGSQSVPGDYTFSGTLHYNTVDSAGTVKPESLAFSFPLEVKPLKQPDGKNAFVEGLKNTGIVVAVIVLFPILLPFMVIYGITHPGSC